VNYRVLAAGFAVVVPTVVLFWRSFGNDPHALPSALEGKRAPAFALETLSGEKVDLQALQGKPFVLNFWATWCGPCVQEHAGLLQVAERFKNDVTFYGVLYGDEKEKALAFLAKHGSAYPTLLDPSGRTAIDYGVAGVPETFVVSAKGEILEKYVGPVNPMEIAELLERVQ
jgi:cytochrome c biogenesis protein CcmG, thiol:disulfide interchange protein DsbE